MIKRLLRLAGIESKRHESLVDALLWLEGDNPPYMYERALRKAFMIKERYRKNET